MIKIMLITKVKIVYEFLNFVDFQLIEKSSILLKKNRKLLTKKINYSINL